MERILKLYSNFRGKIDKKILREKDKKERAENCRGSLEKDFVSKPWEVRSSSTIQYLSLSRERERERSHDWPLDR